ncbi:hypothetical protein [Seonamhaeicola marinus]|uniref:DUF3575 domain-containing protein n=1 Tax=Seonamhaeicola marinus TaxID=1912246 RepID=A0A5D0HFE6_9FLAO|nr:hypothetical protein [Seonamhaeicola marinus]TYA70048.1 hypothetical protein FUA24_22440 [Seonamhaeicola marinus]
MKNVYLFLFFALIISKTSFSQSASVEESTSGVQIGVLGVWFHNETKLSNKIALRSEVGFDGGIWGGSFYPKTGYLFTPSFKVEPRWYYNLNRRVTKGKNIEDNSANFLTLQVNFRPNWFTISNYENVEIVTHASIIPTWGIKRNLGKHFNYETGIGIGYIHYFAKSEGYLEDFGEATANLHLRIGYRF